ncbi:MAG: hypothetical protein RH917_08550 [Lacipirellulaceae bacterium]
MAEKNRRDLLSFATASLTLPAFLGVANTSNKGHAQLAEPAKKADKEVAMEVGYLEIVTPEVDAVCKNYEQLHGVKFSKPNANLGFARTARLAGGGLLGVRAPLRPTETPVVRPYLLVEDIDAAVLKAAEAGGKIALPPMKLAGYGKCAIFIQGGIEHGLWEVMPGGQQ